MKILGIVWEIGAGAALMIDGEIVAAANEERFSRLKNDEQYPQRAIEYVLNEGGIKPNELDLIAFSDVIWNPTYVATRRYTSFTQKDRIREQRKYLYPLLCENKDVKYFDIFTDKIDMEQYPGYEEWKNVIDFMQTRPRETSELKKVNANFFQAFRRRVVSRHLDVSQEKIIFTDHHRGHAYYAFFGGTLRHNNTLVLTADAWGDNLTATTSVVEKRRIKRIAASNNFMVARFYRYITLLLGMKPDEHEYKVMGLAPYAKEKYTKEALKVFQETQYVDGLDFKYQIDPIYAYWYFKNKLEGERFDAIAGALQKYTEEILLQWTKNALRKTGSKHVCFGGGVAMNVKAMMEINNLSELESLFVPPTPSDESQAIGSLYVAMYDECFKKGWDPLEVLKPLKDVYLGPSITDDANVISEIKLASARYSIEKNVSPSKIADFLNKGLVIGIARGKSEFGARALGNRSILADPRNISVIKKINEMIKSRDFWMPFAPVILASRANDYLVGYKKSAGAQFMTLAFKTTPLAQKELIAGLHQADLSSRPQVLEDGVNPFYEETLKEFERLTGVGGLLNTSFNLHGEPIIQGAKDALRVFKLSKLDGLVLNDSLILKKNNTVL